MKAEPSVVSATTVVQDERHPQDRTLTLDQLAHAMRGMPRDAAVMVRLPDGTYRDIAAIRPVHMAADGRALPSGVSTSGAGQRYVITLEVAT